MRNGLRTPHISSQLARVYAGDEASAIAALSKAAPLLWTPPTEIELAEYYFCGALAWGLHCDLTSAEQRPQRVESLAAHHKQLAVWAEQCPATFASRVAWSSRVFASISCTSPARSRSCISYRDTSRPNSGTCFATSE
jgi:hypothetical protein